MAESKMFIGVKSPGNKVLRPQEMQYCFGAKADFIRNFRDEFKFIKTHCNVLYGAILSQTRNYA